MFTLHHNEEENAHEEEDKVSKALWTSGLGAGRSVRERRIDLILSVAPSLTTRLPLYIANHSASCKLGNICFSGFLGRHENCVSAIQRSPCTF